MSLGDALALGCGISVGLLVVAFFVLMVLGAPS